MIYSLINIYYEKTSSIYKEYHIKLFDEFDIHSKEDSIKKETKSFYVDKTKSTTDEDKLANEYSYSNKINLDK